MFPFPLLKTFARNLLLAVLYSSAFYLSIQLPASFSYQLPENANQTVLQQQSINLLPLQEQSSKNIYNPVPLLPVIFLPVTGLCNILLQRSITSLLLPGNYHFRTHNSLTALEIVYRNLRI